MKRARIEIESESEEFLDALYREEHKAVARRFVPTRSGRVFAVVRGVRTGLFSEWDYVKPLVHGRGIDGVYKKFTRKCDALRWYESSLDLPSLSNPLALEIHTSGRSYDVTQENDYFAAICIYFGEDDHRNICIRVPSFVNHIEFHAFLKLLQRAPTNVPLRIITSSKRIAFGINYGLRLWPSHELDTVGGNDWCLINDELARRAGQEIAIDYRKEHNKAYKYATYACNKQISPINEIARKRCVTWVLCAKRLGVHKDIRILVGKILWKHRYSNAVLEFERNNDAFFNLEADA